MLVANRKQHITIVADGKDIAYWRDGVRLLHHVDEAPYVPVFVVNACFTYFVVFALAGSIPIAGSYLGAMAVAQLVAVAAFIPMVMRYAPAPSYRVAAVLFAIGIVGFVALYNMSGTSLPTDAIYVPVLVAGLGRGGLNYIPWNAYNYMADVDEIVTGRRREGAFAGVMTFVRKATQAVAVSGVGHVLEWSGLVPGAATQTPAVVHTIVLVMSVVTISSSSAACSCRSTSISLATPMSSSWPRSSA